MSDLISRQAAIDVMFNFHECYGRRYAEIDLEEFDALPSAQPEIIRCKDCIYYRWEIDMCDYPYATAHNVVHEDDYCSRAERRTDEQTD